jgi:signal transduction histidine kinase
VTLSSRQLLFTAGALTWAIAFRDVWSSGLPAAGLFGSVGFALAFAWTVARVSGTERGRALTLLIQTALALLAMVSTGNGGAGLLLVVVSAQLPLLLRGRWTYGWLVAQFGLATVVLVRARGLMPGFSSAVSETAFGLFAFTMGSLTRRETDARMALACAQSQLSETARDAERLRIARELHDTMGHHLTALNLELELVRHAPGTKSSEAVARAQALTRTLLSEVREVVGALREPGSELLSDSLARLAAERSQPRVHLELCGSASRLGSEAKLALFRCAQEAVTNAMKHGKASNVWLRLESTDRIVALEARDDGQGATRIHPGNGLMGLQERLQPLSGTLSVTLGNGGGVHLRAELPELA